MAQQPGDVPRVVAAPVMRAFQRQPRPLKRLAHPYLARPSVGDSRQVLDVEMRRAEGIRDAERGAVAVELLSVVVAETSEKPLPGLVLVGQHPTRLGQRDAGIHIRLRQRGELRAIRADRRARRPDKDAAPLHALKRGHLHHTQADLDDLTHLTGRRLPFPTGGFDVHHQDAIQSTRHIPSPQAHLPVIVAGLGLRRALGQELMKRGQRGVALGEDVPAQEEPQGAQAFRRLLVVAALEPLTDLAHKRFRAPVVGQGALAPAVEIVVLEEQLLEVEAAQKRLGGFALLLDADQDPAVDHQVVARGERLARVAVELVADDADLLGVRDRRCRRCGTRPVCTQRPWFDPTGSRPRTWRTGSAGRR